MSTATACIIWRSPGSYIVRTPLPKGHLLANVYPILSFLSYAYFLRLDFCSLNFIFGSSLKFTSQEENISFLICPSFSLGLGEVSP